jgi:hypothetical protein
MELNMPSFKHTTWEAEAGVTGRSELQASLSYILRLFLKKQKQSKYAQL